MPATDTAPSEGLSARPEAQHILSRDDREVLSPHVAGWSNESYFKLSDILAEKIFCNSWTSPDWLFKNSQGEQWPIHCRGWKIKQLQKRCRVECLNIRGECIALSTRIQMKKKNGNHRTSKEQQNASSMGNLRHPKGVVGFKRRWEVSSFSGYCLKLTPWTGLHK